MKTKIEVLDTYLAARFKDVPNNAVFMYWEKLYIRIDKKKAIRLGNKKSRVVSFKNDSAVKIVKAALSIEDLKAKDYKRVDKLPLLQLPESVQARNTKATSRSPQTDQPAAIVQDTLSTSTRELAGQTSDITDLVMQRAGH